MYLHQNYLQFLKHLLRQNHVKVLRRGAFDHVMPSQERNPLHLVHLQKTVLNHQERWQSIEEVFRVFDSFNVKYAGFSILCH